MQRLPSQIFNAKADYVLALKGNHPTLYGQEKNWFEQQLSQGFKGIIHSYDKRVEKRKVIILLRNVKFGVFLFLNCKLCITKTIGLVLNGLSWLCGYDIFAIKQPVKFSFV